MRIEGLELNNFRSYESTAFELHPDVTLVVGPNASGKTNLLEGVYVLASTKSFRAKDKDLVRHGQDHFRLVARAGEVDYALGFRAAGPLEKRITHDGVKRTLVGHVGQIQVTLFEPRDLELVTGTPDARRKYLDFILCQTDRAYLRTLQQYRRVLKQRNAVLDDLEVSVVREHIFAWDLKLAELAVEIYRGRTRLIERLNTAIPLLYRDIAGGAQELTLDYVPSVDGVYEEQFLTVLQENLRRDMGAGFTTIGPHREDFAVRFKGSGITAVASRGEVRTVVLAMKLAELRYAHERTGIRPILLLDDVFSELDRDRRGFLLEQLRDHQTIITTTDADAITREFNGGHSIISTGTGVHV